MVELVGRAATNKERLDVRAVQQHITKQKFKDPNKILRGRSDREHQQLGTYNVAQCIFYDSI